MKLFTRFFEISKVSLKAASTNKARSFLTMLGVIIGVASVILLVSIGSGIKGYVTQQFEELGSNLILATPGKVKVEIGGGDPTRNFSSSKFSEKEVKNIERYAQSVTAVTIESTNSKTAQYKNNSYYTLIYATDYNFPNVLNYKLDAGKFFTEADYESSEKVAVIGYTVRDKLFKSENPLGKEVEIDKKKFKVVGILEKKGGFGGTDVDSIIVIPYTTTKVYFDAKTITGINSKIKAGSDINEAKRNISSAMLKTLNKDDFTLFTSEELLSSINNILSILTTGLAGIAAISLLVGGIGIMNIMLVSVTERTREIGLRKAVGATPVNILTQFMFESVMLSTIGGIIGITLGSLGSLALKKAIFTEITPWSVIIAFAFSFTVGIIFGTYPAYKAAKKSPIDALRYE